MGEEKVRDGAAEGEMYILNVNNSHFQFLCVC